MRNTHVQYKRATSSGVKVIAFLFLFTHHMRTGGLRRKLPGHSYRLPKIALSPVVDLTVKCAS